MSNPRENREQEARAGSSDLAQATASGGMIAVVAVILLASWILKADPRRDGPQSAKANAASTAAANPNAEGTPWNMAPLSPVTREYESDRPAAPEPSAETAAIEESALPETMAQVPDASAAPKPAPASEAAPSAMAARAMRDVQRLATRPGAWVAQIAAVCNEDRVADHVRSVGGSDRFYILPVTIKDRSCYRMLWGTYDSAAAATAADLPSTLESGDKLRVIAVKELLR